MRSLKLAPGGACRVVCSRRAVLGGVVGIGVPPLLGCSGSAQPQAFGPTAAGNVSALSVGSIAIIPGVAACIARDASGVYAMTLTCPHAGCDIAVDGTVSGSGIQCACHGSQFDLDGNVRRGPATAPLDHFSVTADAAGNLTVNGDVVVPASTRLPV